MKMKFGLAWAMALMIASPLVAADAVSAEPALPSITPPVCAKPPVIDGDLSDACWEQAVKVEPFYLYRGNGKTSPDVATKMVRDNEWLYVSFTVALPHPESIQQTVLDHDGNVSADDSVEVFVDPGTAGKIYFHYLLNTSNARAERQCLNLGTVKDITWDVPWRSATKITKTGWQAEIGIPLSILAGKGDVSKATINLCANRVLVTLNYMNVVVGNSHENSSWAPVKHGFHEPLSFGRLLGLDAAKITESLLVAEQSVKAGSYASDEKGNFYYDISGTLRSFTAKAGKVKLVAEDKPATGKGQSVSQDVDIAKAGDMPFTLKIPVSAFSGRTAEVSLRDPATDEILQKVALRDMANLSLMRSYARYSYYTTEKEAAIACEIGLPEAELKKVSLIAKDKAGKILAEMAEVSARTFLPVPADKLQLGANAVVVELRRKSSESLYSQDVELIKLAPRPGCEWKIDRADKVILNNGKPFFIFGIMTTGGTTLDYEVAIKDMADMGFNTVCRFNYTPFDKIEELLEMGKKYNLYVMDYPSFWKYNPPADKMPKKDFKDMTHDESWDWLTDNVWLPGAKRLMNHPNLIGWYLSDEPQDNREVAARNLKLHQKLYEADGYHPTEVLYIPPVPEGDEFSRNCDILGIDPYWVPGSGSGESGTPNSVGRQTWLARQRADRDLKLAWVTPCAEYFSGTRMRIFAENEQRAQTYLALVQGAKAMLYYFYPLKHESSHDTFARLSEEMKVIGPACVAPDVEQTISYTPVAFDPYSNLFPDVQVALKKNPAGGYILLAVNYRPYPVEAKFKVSLLEKAGRVTKLFAKDGKVALENGTFTDSFAPMDTRAYTIEGVPETDAPAAIAVDVVAHPEKTDTFLSASAIPGGGAAGKKNILPNSGFEQCSIPGMPDYYIDFRTAKTGLGYRLGDKRGDPLVGLETVNPYEGKQCLRMTPQFFLFQVTPKDVTPATYVFSAYVRGEAKGGSIKFYNAAADNQTSFPLTPEWQRISTTIKYPFGGEGNIFGFQIQGNVWIDAMQFEKGTAPTAYEP